MKKKILPAIFLSLAVTVPTFALSDLETAINNPNVSVFNLNIDQYIENDLNPINREFTILDKTLSHTIHSNSQKGFVNNNTLSVFAKSIDNFTTTGNGGAIYAAPDTNTNIFGARPAGEAGDGVYILTSNHADGDGGAIYQYGMGLVLVADRGENGIRVSGNDATNGGAFALQIKEGDGTGGFLELRNVSVDGNTATQKGGGIYSDGSNIKIQATKGTPVLIKYNISQSDEGNDIYAKNSTVSLITDDNANSSITVGDMKLTNGSELKKSGNVTIDNLSLNGSKLNTADGTIDTNEITNLEVTGTNKWTLDADLSNSSADKINSNVSGNGNIVIDLTPTSVARGDIDSLDVGLTSVGENVTISTRDLQVDNTIYNLSMNDNNTVKIALSQERAGTIQDAIADPEVDSYTLGYNYATSSNLGELVNNEAGNRTFTINGKTIDDDNTYYNGISAVHPSQQSDYLPSGIKVVDGETLNIKDVTYFSNFRKKDPNKANGAAIEAYNADISITNPDNPNKTEFTGNTLTYTSRGGGAIYIEGGNGKDIVPSNSLTIDKAVFRNNYSGNDGGAIYAREVKDINITNTDFIGNKAQEGAGVFVRTYNNTNEATTVNMENVTFDGNSGGYIGGGSNDIQITITDYKKPVSTVTIKDAEFTGRTKGQVLAAGGSESRYNIKSVTLDNINVHDNNLTTGAIYASNAATTTLKNSTIANNKALDALSPLYTPGRYGLHTIENTTFDNNRAVLINTKGNLTIKDSVITNNILDMQHGNTGMISLDQSDLTMNLNNLTFDNNEVYSKDTNYWADGLIENYGSNSTINFNGGTYTNNKAHGNASIITGELKSKFVLNDVKFQNNSVENSLGGMIGYAEQDNPDRAQRVDIRINAVDDNVVFSGNTAPNGKAKDLYVATSGKAYLNAADGHSINMEDVYVEHRPDAQTWDSKKFPTELYLNNKGGTGAINIGKVTLENGANLYSANNRIDNLTTIENLSLVGSASKMFIDANLTGNTIDSFNNVSDGTLNLAVNVLAAPASGSGSLTLFNNADNNLVINQSETVFGDYRYKFTQDEENKGVLNYTSVRAATLQSALADEEALSYNLPGFSILTNDLGEMVMNEQTGTRDFTINGNQGLLTSQNHNGIIVNGAQDKFGTKLTVDNVGVATGFYNSTNANETHSKGSFISASETDIDIKDSVIYGNTTQAKETLSYAKGGAISIENSKDDTQLHTTTIKNTEFTNNSAISDKYQAKGGALYSNFNKLNIENSNFTNNTSTSKSAAYGGAVAFENPYPSTLEGVKLTIKDTVFEGNSAISTAASKAMGGALSLVGNEGPSLTAEIENVTFKNNNVTTAGSNLDRYGLGGAIYNENGRITLKNVQFIDNTATTTYGDGETKYSDIANTGVNGSVTFLGGDITLQGGIVNDSFNKGGHVIVEDGANLTFDTTSQLRQGSLIINNGSVTINSTDENNELDRLSVAQGSNLTLNSALVVGSGDNAGESENKGTIVNNSDSLTIGSLFAGGDQVFTNSGAIKGEGKITIPKCVVNNNGVIENDVTLDGMNAILNSKYENITGNVIFDNSNSVYNVLNDSVIFDNPNRIQSNGQKGKLYLQGNVLSNTTLNYTGDVYLTNGTVLTKGANGNVFENAKNINIQEGNTVTLNLYNNIVDAIDYTGANADLNISDGGLLKLEMDWGDTIHSDSIIVPNNSVLISKLDISNNNDGDTYQMVNASFREKVAIKDIELVTTSGKANSVTYDNTSGNLTASRTSLAAKAGDSEAGNNENAYYTYSMDTNEAGNTENNIIGTLKVQGNGKAIETTGLTVGKAATNKSGALVLNDTNVSSVTTIAEGTGAITVEKDSALTIRADKRDVTLSGTKGANKNVIYMDTPDGENSSIVTFEANNGHSITVNDDIRSNNENNRVVFNSGKINVNGVMDPLRAVNAGADVTRGGQDESITWQLNGGTLKYTNDSYLNNPNHLNSVEFLGGNLDLRNGAASTINLNNILLNGESNIYVDANLANKTMDKLTSANSEYTDGTLHVAGINLLNDASTNKTTINFTTDEDLMGHIDYTGTALSRIFKYNVDYDNTNGNFNFTRLATGSYKDYNPSVLAGAIGAQIGGYLTQLHSYDQAFYNMDSYMLMPSKDRQALKMRNQYAAADGSLTYDTSLNKYENAEGWFRPYATFENVKLKNGPKVDNIGYGTYMGGESRIYELGHNWDAIWGAYVGYNGSHQNYDGVSIYQNGGTLGLSGMLYNGNFFQGLTVNAGASAGRASTMFGHEDFTMLTSGVASKTGYNIELADGKFIIQPSWLMSYSFVNTFDYTNAAGVRIDSDPLHAIQLQPELKFIGNLANGWQPYASVAMVWNIMDKTDFKANDAALPEMSVKPYVKYGAGVRKSWGERFTGFFQTYLTNGGRNGVGLQAGFSWLLGKGSNKK